MGSRTRLCNAVSRWCGGRPRRRRRERTDRASLPELCDASGAPRARCCCRSRTLLDARVQDRQMARLGKIEIPDRYRPARNVARSVREGFPCESVCRRRSAHALIQFACHAPVRAGNRAESTDCALCCRVARCRQCCGSRAANPAFGRRRAATPQIDFDSLRCSHTSARNLHRVAA
jgi:hypothetical protein